LSRSEDPARDPNFRVGKGQSKGKEANDPARDPILQVRRGQRKEKRPRIQ
jgi:hypothetical protein